MGRRTKNRHEPRCTGVKLCAMCGREKHVLEFPARPYNADGLAGSCRHCTAVAESRRRREVARRGYVRWRGSPATFWLEGEEW